MKTFFLILTLQGSPALDRITFVDTDPETMKPIHYSEAACKNATIMLPDGAQIFRGYRYQADCIEIKQ